MQVEERILCWRDGWDRGDHIPFKCLIKIAYWRLCLIAPQKADHSTKTLIYIVACQQGGVSNKPPGLQTATRHGSFGPFTGGTSLVLATYKIF